MRTGVEKPREISNIVDKYRNGKGALIQPKQPRNLVQKDKKIKVRRIKGFGEEF